MRRWFIRVVPLAAVVACTDTPNEPRSAAVPTRPGAARGGTQGGNSKSSLDLIEDDVAAGALDKQNADIYREAALSDQGRVLTDRCHARQVVIPRRQPCCHPEPSALLSS